MRQRGLTLVEVLVALAIVAIALAGAAQALRSLLHGAMRQEQIQLAQLCAENMLVLTRLKSQFPALGQSTTECVQAGQPLTVELHVSATANPSFRRVQARVWQGGESVLSLVTIVGRY